MSEENLDYDQHIEAFAKRMYTLRQAKGQSARDMSLSLGQSHNYMNGLENARNYPKMKTFFYICEYLGITPKDFFDYTNTNPIQANELYNEIQKLDSQSQAHFLTLIKDFNERTK